MQQAFNRYRCVTYKKNSKGEWKLGNISYVSKLNYSKDVTGIDAGTSVGNYILNIDRNIGKDSKGRYVYENDVVMNENKESYIIKRYGTMSILMHIGDNSILHMSDMHKYKWRFIGSIYKNQKL